LKKFQEKLPYKIVDRREGDITSAYADTHKANNILGWRTTESLEEALRSAWKWENKVKENESAQ
jgi:UDP-glucose 4-epimerase